MVPYFMKDNEKVSWPADKANILYQQFRTEIIDQLRKRDLTRGIPDGGQVYDEVTGDINNPEKVTGFKINPLLASQKHDGAEVNNTLVAKWWEYCSEPRDIPSDLSVPMPKPVFKGKAGAPVGTVAMNDVVHTPVNVQAMRNEGKGKRSRNM